MMFLCKIVRVRGAPDLLTSLLKKTNMRVEFQTIIRLMSYLIFVMQICACLLRSGVDFALYSENSWIKSDGIEDGTNWEKYIASLYWSVVTCTTVGYGDITPTNDFELMWAMIIILVGVAVFSYVLGDLSSQFGELTRSRKANEDRLRQISDLD
jgi:hypothetical protein